MNFKLDVERPGDRSWWDIGNDVIGPIKWAYGIRQSGILDRTGTTGTLSFTEDNDLALGQYGDRFSVATAAYVSRSGGGPYTPGLSFLDSDSNAFDLFGLQTGDSDGVAIDDPWFQIANKLRLFVYDDRTASTKDGVYVGTAHAYLDSDLPLRSAVKVSASHINLFSTDFASDFSGVTGTIDAKFVVPSLVSAGARYFFKIAVDANNYIASYLDSDGKLHFEHKAGGTLAAVTPGTTSDLTTDDFQITMTWDALDGMTAYLNGARLGNAAVGTWAGAPVSFVVGAADTDSATALDSDYALGVSLWNSVLPRPDALVHLNEKNSWHPDVLMSQSSSDLIGYWPMKEGAGTAVENWSATPIYFKFVGRIKSIKASPGRFGDNAVAVEATDWLDDAATYEITNIPVQVNTSIDRALYNVVSYSPSQPTGIILSPGADTLPFTTYDTKQGVTVLSEIAKLAATELGYIYMRGTVNTEGIHGTALACEGRHDRMTNTTPAFALTDDATSDVIRVLESLQDIEDLKNAVEITTHPADIDSDNVVVTSLPTATVLSIPGNGTFIYSAKYLDSDNAFKVVGVSSIVAPVRNTDFVINSNPAGSGTDLSNDYKATLGTIDSDNLLAYYPLNDLAGDVFRNEVDNTGAKDASANSTGQKSSSSTTTGSTGGSTGQMITSQGTYFDRKMSDPRIKGWY